LILLGFFFFFISLESFSFRVSGFFLGSSLAMYMLLWAPISSGRPIRVQCKQCQLKNIIRLLRMRLENRKLKMKMKKKRKKKKKKKEKEKNNKKRKVEKEKGKKSQKEKEKETERNTKKREEK